MYKKLGLILGGLALTCVLLCNQTVNVFAASETTTVNGTTVSSSLIRSSSSLIGTTAYNAGNGKMGVTVTAYLYNNAKPTTTYVRTLSSSSSSMPGAAQISVSRSGYTPYLGCSVHTYSITYSNSIHEEEINLTWKP